MIFITRIHGKYFKCVIIMSKSLIDWIEIGICVKLISSEQSVTKYYAVLNEKNKNKIHTPDCSIYLLSNNSCR